MEIRNHELENFVLILLLLAARLKKWYLIFKHILPPSSFFFYFFSFLFNFLLLFQKTTTIGKSASLRCYRVSFLGLRGLHRICFGSLQATIQRDFASIDFKLTQEFGLKFCLYVRNQNCCNFLSFNQMFRPLIFLHLPTNYPVFNYLHTIGILIEK